MKKLNYLFRSPSGEIRASAAESANAAANLLGKLLSWDADLNTLELQRHGKVERWTFEGHREVAKPKRASILSVAQVRKLLTRKANS